MLDFDPAELLPRPFREFLEFHRENPQVYLLFLSFANEARKAGAQKFGARLIGERIRWHCKVEARGYAQYKLNDHYWPYYARLAMLKNPELSFFFETRNKDNFPVSDETILRHVER